MVIIALQRGLSNRGRIAISFRIDLQQYVSVSKWRKRNVSEWCVLYLNSVYNVLTFCSDMTDCLCLSLACYPCSYFRAALAGGSGEPSLREVASSRSIWPQTGGLSLNAKYNNNRHDFPLSPPLFVGRYLPSRLVHVAETCFCTGYTRQPDGRLRFPGAWK